MTASVPNFTEVTPHRRPARRLCAIAAATLLLCACGQKGPLFMPAKPAPLPAVSAKPAPATAAPGSTAATPGSTGTGTSAIPPAGNVVPVTPAPVTPDSPAMTAPPGAVVPTNK